jgi:hypothetical protein
MTLQPAEFLAECRRRGVRLSVTGDKIRASGTPPSKPDAFTRYLVHHKAALLPLIVPEKLALAPNPQEPGLPPVPEVGVGEASVSSKVASSEPDEQESESAEVFTVLVQQALADAYLEAQEGTLNARLGTWAKSRGVTVRDPSRWLALAVARAERLEARYGPRWFTVNEAGVELADDLAAFALWYLREETEALPE